MHLLCNCITFADNGIIKMERLNFYKNHKKDIIFWVETPDTAGKHFLLLTN